FEPMNPAPPVTRQSMRRLRLEPFERKGVLIDGGPVPLTRYGPHRKDDPGRAGGRPKPARKGAMLAGQHDIRVFTKHSSQAPSGQHDGASADNFLRIPQHKPRNQTLRITFVDVTFRFETPSDRKSREPAMQPERSLQTYPQPLEMPAQVEILDVPLALTDYR